jgi:hypothetical protein
MCLLLLELKETVKYPAILADSMPCLSEEGQEEIVDTLAHARQEYYPTW